MYHPFFPCCLSRFPSSNVSIKLHASNVSFSTLIRETMCDGKLKKQWCARSFLLCLQAVHLPAVTVKCLQHQAIHYDDPSLQSKVEKATALQIKNKIKKSSTRESRNTELLTRISSSIILYLQVVFTVIVPTNVMKFVSVSRREFCTIRMLHF